MAFNTLFPAPDHILRLAPASKSALLQTLADEAARRLDRPREEVLDALRARERLGSTALGRGIALPHTRMASLSTPLALLARLAKPIDFEARDGEPVDLVFMVLWPEAAAEGFLPALSGICRALRNEDLPRRLRQAKDAAEVLALMHAADSAPA